MFRKLLMSTVAATATIGSAYAADLPSRRPPPPMAYVPPVPIFTWTGFYVGVNAGGAFRGNNNNGFNNAVFFGGAAPVFGFNNANNNSGRFIGGGQAGVNWQINQFVLGVEGDGQALVGRNNSFGLIGTNGTSSTSFLGTVRGRAGIAFDRFLVYGTGGVAFGGGGWPNSAVATVAGIPAFFTTNGSNNNMRVGYAAGAGVEYAFTNNWSVKVEYLFTDLGRNNRTFLLGGTGAGFTINNREQNHIVRAGLNYRFNWAAPGPVLARY
jgi:outer membrane immunogenic protein